ncbi:MAG: PadR family transcriptional regulator [Planctomycetota bacterium]|nr:MAG: PadR family transcriptional regulator [Planctomycetota bacterium]REK24531.1 MAG: PadR family transcriptional regulator [Planctomycetota bacterium]REK32438.1 MAG: PadR family transcriptional regulator [Planctomycetota bacterium]
MDTKLLNGTVEMLILEVVSQGPSYGYEITQTVISRSDGRFELKEGSLYPALHRLERQMLLSSYWTEHDGRRRKYYKLTTTGRKALAARRKEWREFASGVNGVLGLELGVVSR